MILPRSFAACAFRAATSGLAVVLRTATFIVLSSRATYRAAQSRRSGFMVVFRRQLRHVTFETSCPGDDVVDSLFQREGVAPAQFSAQLKAVERVGSVLARTFGADLDAVLELLAEPGQDHLDQGADRGQFVAGDMIGVAERAVASNLYGGIRDIGHVDEHADRL